MAKADFLYGLESSCLGVLATAASCIFLWGILEKWKSLPIFGIWGQTLISCLVRTSPLIHDHQRQVTFFTHACWCLALSGIISLANHACRYKLNLEWSHCILRTLFFILSLMEVYWMTLFWINMIIIMFHNEYSGYGVNQIFFKREFLQESSKSWCWLSLG